MTVVGALLLRAASPGQAAELLSAYLLDPGEAQRVVLEAAGVSAAVASDFRHVLPTEPGELAHVCALGAAWAEGRRSIEQGDMWKPVVTGRDLDVRTFDRLTAETLIGLIMEARERIRLFSPFVDAPGVDTLAFALAAATRRGVEVVFAFRRVADRSGAAGVLARRAAEDGRTDLLRVVPLDVSGAFPHLKLLLVDGCRAYIGSANVTYSGLTDNFEVGAVVQGAGVAVYEALFNDLVGHELDPDTADRTSARPLA